MASINDASSIRHAGDQIEAPGHMDEVANGPFRASTFLPLGDGAFVAMGR
ncbi:MAG: hypothetical protein ACRDIY_08315 [Chloroflexota bacterium]